MKKKKISLRMGLLTIIVICWLVPIIIMVTLAGVLFDRSYRQSVQQETDASAQSAQRQVQMQLENAISDSKAVSYDGVIRSAYRSFQADRDQARLYRSTNDYLNQQFARETQYKTVSIHFWGEEVGVSAYHLSSGTTGYELLNQCRESAPFILELMQDADTDIRFLCLDGRLFMARNLLESSFTPYATVVMMLDTDLLFRPLSAISRICDLQLCIDDTVFSLGENGSIEEQEDAQRNADMRCSVKVDDHELAFTANMVKFDIWEENPWLGWAVVFVILMVFPLLAVMIGLFYHHVTRPMETLAQANLLVQSGQRGYEISMRPPNTEFEKLYSHFNAMSTELKSQFDRSFLEQQATQKAQIKALQSQINPHFLNNTLEIINWEARLADNQRVSAMIEALSTMLSATLDRDGRNQIPLREEMGYVDAYLYIIRERLGEGVRITKEIMPAALDRMIPRLILQPIVENAVEHDITPRHGGRLCVRASCTEARMILEVEHDGKMTDADRDNIRRLLSPETTEKGQVGLKNVYRRLKLLYGEEGNLTIEEVTGGSILARISFPLN